MAVRGCDKIIFICTDQEIRSKEGLLDYFKI